MQKYLDLLAKQMYDIALVRNKKCGTEIDTIGLLKHCATEVVEATESAVNFLRVSRLTNDGTDFEIGSATKTEALYKKDKEHFTSELADIIACVLIIAGKEGLDMTHAVTECLNKNRKRAEEGKHGVSVR